MDAGYTKAYRPLADMFYKGRAIPQDIPTARKLYKKAAKLGDELAQKKYVMFAVVEALVPYSMNSRLQELFGATAGKSASIIDGNGETTELSSEDMDKLLRAADAGDEAARKQICNFLTQRFRVVLDKTYESLS